MNYLTRFNAAASEVYKLGPLIVIIVEAVGVANNAEYNKALESDMLVDLTYFYYHAERYLR